MNEKVYVMQLATVGGRGMMSARLLLGVALCLLLGAAEPSEAQRWELVESELGPMATVESSAFELAVTCSLANSPIAWLMLRDDTRFRHGRIDVEWNSAALDRYYFRNELQMLMATAHTGQKQVANGDAYEPRLPIFLENMRRHRTVGITATTIDGPVDDVISLDGVADVIDSLSCQSVANSTVFRPEHTCVGEPTDAACWMEIADQPGCYRWTPSLQPDQTVTWTGECVIGLANGPGTETVLQDGTPVDTYSGLLVDGKRIPDPRE